ncbi:MAG TPA: HPr family phosphocarrier protein [Micromonosporaceae bacterium]|nr:HPr family phosphocarrier protein [Micromonosporaceae bacterium]
MSASSEPAMPVEQVVVLPKHLHARPAGQVAQAAARYPDTTIELSNDHRTANARSILAVMGLGAVTGDQIRVRAAGADPAGAAAAVAAILTAAEE